jgi:type VI secretion system protein ImpB
MGRQTQSQTRNTKERPTRVDVVYKLHLPDGTQVQERLPFVIGVIADLKGDVRDDAPASECLPFDDKDRNFAHIHKDNFDDILAHLKPHLKFAVADTLRGTGLFQVDLDFRALDDFHPDQIVRNVAPLKCEQERRKRLENLLGMLGSDPRLERRLQEIVDDPKKRAEFLAEMTRRETGGSSP